MRNKIYIKTENDVISQNVADHHQLRPPATPPTSAYRTVTAPARRHRHQTLTHFLYRSDLTLHTMTSTSIFKDGKLKPGIYKIQNAASNTYVDIREHPKELCCRPATLLEGKGRVGSVFV